MKHSVALNILGHLACNKQCLNLPWLSLKCGSQILTMSEEENLMNRSTSLIPKSCLSCIRSVRLELILKAKTAFSYARRVNVYILSIQLVIITNDFDRII